MFRYPASKIETHPDGETIEFPDGSAIIVLGGGGTIIRERGSSGASHAALAEAPRRAISYNDPAPPPPVGVVGAG